MFCSLYHSSGSFPIFRIWGLNGGYVSGEYFKKKTEQKNCVALAPREHDETNKGALRKAWNKRKELFIRVKKGESEGMKKKSGVRDEKKGDFLGHG
ncbi:hypothetical protein G9A89_023955 [Geosiphon pyriformis]|nr:hypothetical protein G9A89_023955 [Geosiphon pyriformis]